AMQAIKPTDHHLMHPDRTAQIEGCVLAFFSNVADIELLTDSHPMDHLATDKSFTAIINFGGSEQGFVALNCSEALVRQLAVSMLGDEGEMDEAYLNDVLGEIINILTDNLLEKTADHQYYKVSIPAVIRSDRELLQKLLTDRRGYTGSFTHGSSRVLFKVVIRPPDCIAASAVHATHPATALH
ncbi:chemotaxis protein CheX, partial [bacterium]|nr:chemotaxis protein CheX [bacterium]